MGNRTLSKRQNAITALRARTIGLLGIFLLVAMSVPVAGVDAQEEGTVGQEGQESAAPPSVEPMQRTEGAPDEPAEQGETQSPGAVHISGDKPVFRGLANDLFAWAWLPEVAGTVEDNTFMGGQRVTVQNGASIGGDLFIFAQTGTVAGQVAGDVYCFCQELTITAEGSVGGRIESRSEILTINGDVEGPIDFGGGVLTIDGTLRRGGSVQTGVLEIGPEARIGGVLEYECAREASVDSGAEIAGELRHIAPEVLEGATGGEEDEEAGWFSPSAVLWKLWHFLSSLLVGSLLLALGGLAARTPALRLLGQPAQGLGFGFVIFIILPVGAVIAMAVVVGIPLGILTILVFLVALYLARLVAAQAIGELILRRVRQDREPSAYAALAIGLVVFFILVAIPYLGFLLWLAAIFAGLGAIFMAFRPPATEELSLEAPTAA